MVDSIALGAQSSDTTFVNSLNCCCTEQPVKCCRPSVAVGYTLESLHITTSAQLSLRSRLGLATTPSPARTD